MLSVRTLPGARPGAAGARARGGLHAQIQKCLEKRDGPVIAASDYVRSFSDQLRPYVNKSFYSFGTDGYGRSDTRKNLRKFFEVDKEHIVAYTLSALAQEQLVASKDAEKAIKKFKIDKDKTFPTKL